MRIHPGLIFQVLPACPVAYLATTRTARDAPYLPLLRAGRGADRARMRLTVAGGGTGQVAADAGRTRARVSMAGLVPIGRNRFATSAVTAGRPVSLVREGVGTEPFQGRGGRNDFDHRRGGISPGAKNEKSRMGEWRADPSSGQGVPCGHRRWSVQHGRAVFVSTSRRRQCHLPSLRQYNTSTTTLEAT